MTVPVVKAIALVYRAGSNRLGISNGPGERLQEFFNP